jgi:hypothetical protein
MQLTAIAVALGAAAILTMILWAATTMAGKVNRDE